VRRVLQQAVQRFRLKADRSSSLGQSLGGSPGCAARAHRCCVAQNHEQRAQGGRFARTRPPVRIVTFFDTPSAPLRAVSPSTPSFALLRQVVEDRLPVLLALQAAVCSANAAGCVKYAPEPFQHARMGQNRYADRLSTASGPINGKACPPFADGKTREAAPVQRRLDETSRSLFSALRPL